MKNLLDKYSVMAGNLTYFKRAEPKKGGPGPFEKIVVPVIPEPTMTKEVAGYLARTRRYNQKLLGSAETLARLGEKQKRAAKLLQEQE